MSYPKIDAKNLAVFPLAERKSLTRIEDIAANENGIAAELPGNVAEKVQKVRTRILAARQKNAGVMLTYGAHLVKNGAGPLVNRMIEHGHLTHLATQGGWRHPRLGVCFPRHVDRIGSRETLRWDVSGVGTKPDAGSNLAIAVGASEGLGLGESVGRLIDTEQLTVPDPRELARSIADAPTDPLCAARADLLGMIGNHGIDSGTIEVPHPFKQYSVLARAYRHRVPLTVHPGIGYDIIVNHPMYHGAAIGRAAENRHHAFLPNPSIFSMAASIFRWARQS